MDFGIFFFFFFQAEDGIRDLYVTWSSDVCSSDLFAVEAIRDGKRRDEAMIDAGMKRARPIVMTTIAMAAGMMPSALAFGDGGEFRSPMALADRKSVV